MSYRYSSCWWVNDDTVVDEHHWTWNNEPNRFISSLNWSSRFLEFDFFKIKLYRKIKSNDLMQTIKYTGLKKYDSFWICKSESARKSRIYSFASDNCKIKAGFYDFHFLNWQLNLRRNESGQVSNKLLGKI